MLMSNESFDQMRKSRNLHDVSLRIPKNDEGDVGLSSSLWTYRFQPKTVTLNRTLWFTVTKIPL